MMVVWSIQRSSRQTVHGRTDPEYDYLSIHQYDRLYQETSRLGLLIVSWLGLSPSLHIPCSPGTQFSRGIPRFSWILKIGEFLECSPFLFPGNVAFGRKKFLKIHRWLPFSGPLRKINWQLKSSQRDRSFKLIKKWFRVDFFSHG